MSKQNETFNYSYSASQQEEINRIRNKYLPDVNLEKTDKMEQLRRLDASVTNKATVLSLAVGIIGALIMGMGMSLIMTDIGDYLGISSKLPIGIIIGLVGIIGIILAYPLYQRVIAKERKKIAPQILKLADELSKK